MSDFFFKPDIVQRQDNYNSFTRGLLTQHAQEVDQYFTEEVRKYNIVFVQNLVICIDFEQYNMKG